VPSRPPREPQQGLGSAIRTLRERARLSPSELAERAGISISLLSQVESGDQDPRWGDMRRVARGLGVSMEELSEVAEENDRGNNKTLDSGRRGRS
jgi:transcriptional regulator with XRE-family HTH domain